MCMHPVLEFIRGKLIVSCQALEDEPLHSSFIMSRMALAAKEGGAAGIRAQSKADIDAIMEVCDLPLIGIIKRQYSDSEIYITPTAAEIEELLTTRCQIIALDATDRKRPGGESCSALLHMIQDGGRLAMADCSTYEECLAAAEMGFDIVSTTLCGYTPYSAHIEGPDFDLIRQCCQNINVPVIAEGKINTPQDLAEVFRCGAFSAVVGGAITRPQLITRRFVDAISQSC